MNPAVIETIFINWIIPELGRWMRTRGAVPTRDEIVAELATIATEKIGIGEEFLRSKGVVDPGLTE